ncbi:AzlD domain-containing protein [Galbitalea sp. SE-J8]|nr:AzlD domain-containing protein [Galbitalea sp. SE-J8]
MLDAIAIVLSGVVTYLTRVVFLVDRRIRPPGRSLRYLPLVGPAVLGAIAVPGILAPLGVISFAQTAPAVVAAVVAVVLQRLTRQLVVGLVAGLLVWWGLVALLTAAGWR